MLEHRERGGSGAARRSDVAAQRRGRSRAFAAHKFRRALDRAAGQAHRQLRRQAQSLGRGGERLGEGEHIGRARARDRCHRVDRALVLKPEERPDCAEQARAPAPLLRVDVRVGESRGDAPADCSRRIGHRPHDRPRLRKPRHQVGDGLARDDRQQERPFGRERGDLWRDLIEALRLDREHEHLRRGRNGRVERNAAARGERSDLGRRIGLENGQRRSREAGVEPALPHRSAHLASPDQDEARRPLGHLFSPVRFRRVRGKHLLDCRIFASVGSFRQTTSKLGWTQPAGFAKRFVAKPGSGTSRRVARGFVNSSGAYAR